MVKARNRDLGDLGNLMDPLQISREIDRPAGPVLRGRSTLLFNGKLQRMTRNHDMYLKVEEFGRHIRGNSMQTKILAKGKGRGFRVRLRVPQKENLSYEWI